jgi:hypothetical protein
MTNSGANFNFAGVFHLAHSGCDCFAMVNRHATTDFLNFGDRTRRDGQLPQADSQQQNRIQRIATHLTTHIDRNFAAVAGFDRLID